MNRCRAESSREDDAHGSSEQYSRPPPRTRQAIRDPRVDKRQNNREDIGTQGNDVDLRHREPRRMPLDVVTLDPEDHRVSHLTKLRGEGEERREQPDMPGHMPTLDVLPLEQARVHFCLSRHPGTSELDLGLGEDPICLGAAGELGHGYEGPECAWERDAAADDVHPAPACEALFTVESGEDSSHEKTGKERPDLGEDLDQGVAPG